MSDTFKIIQPSGIVDSVNANNLRKDINELVKKGTKSILIDFRDVTFINSSGLGMLVAVLKFVRSSGGNLFFCSLNDQVKMMIELTKMDRVFDTFVDRKDFENKILTNK